MLLLYLLTVCIFILLLCICLFVMNVIYHSFTYLRLFVCDRAVYPSITSLYLSVLWSSSFFYLFAFVCLRSCSLSFYYFFVFVRLVEFFFLLLICVCLLVCDRAVYLSVTSLHLPVLWNSSFLKEQKESTITTERMHYIIFCLYSHPYVCHRVTFLPFYFNIC
jgi:hypothetical protein